MDNAASAGDNAPDGVIEVSRAAQGRTRGRRPGIFIILLRILVPLAVLVAAVTVVGYMIGTKPQVASQPLQERTWIVRTVTAQQASIAPKLRLYGTIVAGRDAELRPLVGGRVIKVGPAFAEGGQVRKGDLLVQIDPFEYRATVTERKAQLAEAESRLKELQIELASQRNSLKSDEAQLALRKRELARRERLLARRTGSEKSVDDARLALNEQNQRIIDRKRTIATLETKLTQQFSAIQRAKVALERAEKDLRDTRLVAPFDGFLRDTQAAVGKKISVNDRVARLVDARWLEASFQVSDEQYGRLVAAGAVQGKTATILWKTRAKTFRFAAMIERISGQVASDTGGVVLYARIKDTDLKTVLRPGVFVEVEIEDRVYRKVFRLPNEALDNGGTIYVVKRDLSEGLAAPFCIAQVCQRFLTESQARTVAAVSTPVWRLEARTIRVVGREGNDVLVRGDLKNGDRVVASTFPEIGPGARVEPR